MRRFVTKSKSSLSGKRFRLDRTALDGKRKLTIAAQVQSAFVHKLLRERTYEIALARFRYYLGEGAFSEDMRSKMLSRCAGDKVTKLASAVFDAVKDRLQTEAKTIGMKERKQVRRRLITGTSAGNVVSFPPCR